MTILQFAALVHWSSE